MSGISMSNDYAAAQKYLRENTAPKIAPSVKATSAKIISRLASALWVQMEWSAHYADLKRNIGQKVPASWSRDRSKARAALHDMYNRSAK